MLFLTRRCKEAVDVVDHASQRVLATVIVTEIRESSVELGVLLDPALNMGSYPTSEEGMTKIELQRNCGFSIKSQFKQICYVEFREILIGPLVRIGFSADHSIQFKRDNMKRGKKDG